MSTNNNNSSINKLCSKLDNKSLNSNGRAIIYTRVSTPNQTMGTSLDSQDACCREYCVKNGYTIIDKVKEISSAQYMNKQQYLNNILNNYEDIHLIILEPSRLSRNLKDGVNFLDVCKNKNIVIHFVQNELVSTNTSDIKTIISGVHDGEIESKNLGLRVKRSVKFRKANKEYYPSVIKYGYKLNKQLNNDKITRTLVKEPHEQLVITLINKLYYGSDIKTIQNLLMTITGEYHELFNQKSTNEVVTRVEYGNMCIVDVAKFLNSIPIMKRNKEWTSSSVSSLL